MSTGYLVTRPNLQVPTPSSLILRTILTHLTFKMSFTFPPQLCSGPKYVNPCGIKPAILVNRRFEVQSSFALNLRAREKKIYKLKVVVSSKGYLQDKPLAGQRDQIGVVLKFGGSSLASAARMEEVAQIVCSSTDTLPCVVLSAMGKTTNLLIEAGELAIHTVPSNVKNLVPLREIYKLHLKTAEELKVSISCKEEVTALLDELSQLLIGISIMQDLTFRARDSLVSFGERLSTRLFSALLNKKGVRARQSDAFKIGMITTDDFTQAEVLYSETLPQLKRSLHLSEEQCGEVQVVTGFLGRGLNTGAITTLGRGGSDLTATVIGAALNLNEVQVWKDVDGVLTSDPRIVPHAKPVSYLTYEEATELAFFGASVLHPSAMQPALQFNNMGVRVKNSYNRDAPGTLITRSRSMDNVLMTSLVLKSNITMMDIISTRMLGQFGFLARIFNIFKDQKISVDVVATSEIAVSLTLDPSRLWTRDLIDSELEALVECFDGIAKVSLHKNMAILSLICNMDCTSEILERVFSTLKKEDVHVMMMSQGASKTNISLIIKDAQGKQAVKALHKEFFE